MVDNLVSVRRYIKAMIAATDRSECLGLVLLAGLPADLDGSPPQEGPDASALLGPYLGMARPAVAGEEVAGVVLPDGTRVLARGLDAHCWPGSEPAFREELGVPSPASWNRGPAASTDVSEAAAAAIAWYVGVDVRALPVAAVLDPGTRRGVVVSLPRGVAAWGYLRRLVAELGDWPLRRLAVVDALVAARVDRAELEHPENREVSRVRALFAEARRCPDEHERATLTARCVDVLRAFEATAVPPRRSAPPAGRDGAGSEADSDEQRRSALLGAVITERRGELDRCDRASCTADAADRAARAEFGDLRSTSIHAPDALAGWRIEHLRAHSALRRRLRVFG